MPSRRDLMKSSPVISSGSSQQPNSNYYWTVSQKSTSKTGEPTLSCINSNKVTPPLPDSAEPSDRSVKRNAPNYFNLLLAAQQLLWKVLARFRVHKVPLRSAVHPYFLTWLLFRVAMLIIDTGLACLLVLLLSSSSSRWSMLTPRTYYLVPIHVLTKVSTSCLSVYFPRSLEIEWQQLTRWSCLPKF
jgi:hypothetical protein